MSFGVPNPTDETEAAVDEYLRRVDAGESVSRDEFVTCHPECADELRSFFRGADLFEKLVRRSATEPTQSNAVRDSGSVSTERSGREPWPALPAMFGRYRVDECLGRGAMGAVYRAHDAQLDRPVALKIPKFSDEATPETEQRLVREARAAAILSHPNLCRVYDVGQASGTWFIAMELIEGRPLSHFIETGPPYSPHRAATLVRKLALAMQVAHDQGVIHRDLKPSNILIDLRGEPIVMDFGLSCRPAPDGQGRLTQEGTLVGSPAYMSPEQARADSAAIGPASDVYGLGVIFYELLTGQLPFTGSVLSILAKVLSEPPTPVTTLRPEVDAELAAICHRMLAKQPSERFATMTEVANALTTWLQRTASDRDEAAHNTTVPSQGSRSRETSVEGSQSPEVSRLRLRSGGSRKLLLAGSILAAIAVVAWLTRDNWWNNSATAPDASIAGAVSGTPANNLPTPPNVGHEHVAVVHSDRAAAEWALSIGGQVEIDVAGQIQVLRGASAKIPSEPFVITRLHFGAEGKSSIASTDFARLVSLKSLVELGIAGAPRVTDEGVQHLVSVPSLTSVSLFNTNVGDESARILSGLPILDALQLGDTKVTDIGLKHLADYPALRYFAVGPLITDDGAKTVCDCRELLKLSLSGPNLSDRGLACLKDHPNLNGLNIGNAASITSEGLAVLRTIPQMGVVTIHGKLLTDIGCQHLAAIPTLKSLMLFHAASGPCLARLELLTNLETLDLLNTKLTDADCTQLPDLPGLKTLRITNGRITDASVESLARRPHLTTLEIRQTDMTEAGVARLRQLAPHMTVVAVVRPSPAMPNPPSQPAK